MTDSRDKFIAETLERLTGMTIADDTAHYVYSARRLCDAALRIARMSACDESERFFRARAVDMMLGELSHIVLQIQTRITIERKEV